MTTSGQNLLPHSAARSPSERILALDGLRGIAAIGVVLFHTYGTYTFWCWSFVDLFFVLSGFLITQVIITSNLPTPTLLKHFWMRRVIRIWPVYYAALFICLAYGVAKTLFVDPSFQMNQVWQSFFFLQFFNFQFEAVPQNWDYIPHFLHSWSIAVEEQFYLIWPFIIFALRGRWWLLLPLGLLGMVGSFYLRQAGAYDLALFTRPDGLILGSLVAIAYEHRQYRYWIWALLPLSLWGFWTVGTYLLQGYTVFLGNPIFDRALLGSIILTPAFAIVYTVLLIAVLRWRTSALNRMLATKPLLYLGSISYAIYIFHAPIAGFFKGIAIAKFGGEVPEWMHALVLPCSIIAGHVSSLTLERFFLRYKHRYPMIVQAPGLAAVKPQAVAPSSYANPLTH